MRDRERSKGNGRIAHASSRHREPQAEDMTRLREDLMQVKDDLAALTKNLMSAGRDRIHDLDERIRTSANAAVDNTRKRIEARPLTALGGALAAGLLLGAVIRWARHRQEA